MLFISKLKQILSDLKGGLTANTSEKSVFKKSLSAEHDSIWPEYDDKYYKPDSPEVRIMVHHARHCKPSKKKVLKSKRIK